MDIKKLIIGNDNFENRNKQSSVLDNDKQRYTKVNPRRYIPD